MAVWDDLTGQSEAIAVFQAAVASSALGGSDDSAMTHSWLITGPPGSGRSNLAYAFATALLSDGTPEGEESVRRQVQARTHPDLGALTTDRVIITVQEVRDFVATSYYSPSVSRYRVMVIEDADRMMERSSNALLKALEEPPPRTVWILCAPSEADLLPTIRSRARSVRLRVPSVDDVAALISRRDGVDLPSATRAAREAQSHIGMARRLATNVDARSRREETLEIALGIRSVSGAMVAATKLLALANADASAFTEERELEERASTLRSLGIEPGGTIPPALRSQIKTLEEDQKRREKRSQRDGIDRILVDLLSLYRDILLLQLGVETEPINLSIYSKLVTASELATAQETLATMDAISTARKRIESNVPPGLALEAMLVSARRGSTRA